MASKTQTPLTWTQSERIAKAFKPSDPAIAARVRALIPVCDRSAATIVDEVWSAYESKGVTLAWAFGESTIQTSLNVAKAYTSIAMSLRDKLSTADETAILASLVAIRRTRKSIPVAGRKTGMAGGETALNAAIAAMVKSPPAKWRDGVSVVESVVAKAEAADRRGRTAAKRQAADDETLQEIADTHNETAADVRKGNEGAEKNNTKAHRASKHERKSTVVDPLKPSAETQAHMPADNTGNPRPNTPDPLRDASVDALIKELHKRVTLGYVPTGKQDAAMTALGQAWEERVGEAPASKAGTYLERSSAPVSEALAGSVAA